MGFWDKMRIVGEVAGEMAAKASKGVLDEMSRNPQTWYRIGHTDGKCQAERKTYYYESNGIDPQCVKAYDRGYDDGRAD